MPETFPELDESLGSFISAQKIFFVATAPDNFRDGHISLSPKGSGTLEILDGKTIVYGDFCGTENEIATNLNQNGKMTMVFISFDKTPMILRLYGRGEAIALDTPLGREITEKMKAKVAERSRSEVTTEIRQWIVLRIDTIKTGCGSFIPNYQYLGEREQLKG